MYVKATNNTVDSYPYSIEQLRVDNPSTSFPDGMSVEQLAEWDVHPVTIAADPSYDPLTHKIQQAAEPVLVNGAWLISKTVVALTDEEIQNNLDAEAMVVRVRRDGLLAESDWVTVKAVDQNAQDGLGIQVPQVWLDYRQALRDVTSQAGFPYNVTWPTAP
jgi:hypothetical protein